MAPKTRGNSKTLKRRASDAATGQIAKKAKTSKEDGTVAKVLPSAKTKRVAKPKAAKSKGQTVAELPRDQRAANRAQDKEANIAKYEEKKANARARRDARKADKEAAEAAEGKQEVNDSGEEQQQPVASPLSSLPDYEVFEEAERLEAEAQAAQKLPTKTATVGTTTLENERDLTFELGHKGSNFMLEEEDRDSDNGGAVLRTADPFSAFRSRQGPHGNETGGDQSSGVGAIDQETNEADLRIRLGELAVAETMLRDRYPDIEDRITHGDLDDIELLGAQEYLEEMDAITDERVRLQALLEGRPVESPTIRNEVLHDVEADPSDQGSDTESDEHERVTTDETHRSGTDSYGNAQHRLTEERVRSMASMRTPRYMQDEVLLQQEADARRAAHRRYLPELASREQPYSQANQEAIYHEQLNAVPSNIQELLVYMPEDSRQENEDLMLSLDQVVCGIFCVLEAVKWPSIDRYSLNNAEACDEGPGVGCRSCIYDTTILPNFWKLNQGMSKSRAARPRRTLYLPWKWGELDMSTVKDMEPYWTLLVADIPAMASYTTKQNPQHEKGDIIEIENTLGASQITLHDNQPTGTLSRPVKAALLRHGKYAAERLAWTGSQQSTWLPVAEKQVALHDRAWHSGAYVILNAWCHALNLPLDVAFEPEDPEDFQREAYRVINIALNGHANSRMIYAFLASHGYILSGEGVSKRVHKSRSFVSTVRLLNGQSVRARWQKALSYEDLLSLEGRAKCNERLAC